MKILGVDPSIRATGLVILDVEKRKVEGWCIHTSPREPTAQRLLQIMKACEEVIQDQKPDRVVIESVIYHRNPRTAIQMGAVRGVLLATFARFGLPVQEISPTRVKRVLTGYGQASKSQLARMAGHILGVDLGEWPNDLTDALALGLVAATEAHLA